MDIYLVGGAVRDELLGYPVAELERDWVVVGTTPDEMLALGYRQVGRDFPVYLHPDTHEQYALARTERKSGRGHVGFECNSDPSVTLEEDLSRRDLTINAIARDSAGALIDPHDGQADLEGRCLRHVSPAFVEDPLRVLRVARFAARLADREFAIHPDTMGLMREIAQSGELQLLPSERVWTEMERALAEPAPAAFFDALESCGALAVLLPELTDSEQWRRLDSERAGDDGQWRRLASGGVVKTGPELRFALLLSGLDKATVKGVCDRIKPPLRFRNLALMCCTLGNDFCRARDLSAAKVLRLLESADALRRRERFGLFLDTCALAFPEYADNRNWLAQAADRCAGADVADLADQDISGRELGQKLRERRTALIGELQGETSAR